MDDFMAGAPDDATELKRTLIDIITWAESRRPRSVQVELGPSDLGAECDRRIGYKMADLPRANYTGDPWVTFVGSAIHSRLQESIDTWSSFHGSSRFLTEQSAPLDGIIKSHPDLLDRERKMVIDHKSVSTDLLKKYRTGDAMELFPGYIIQVQLYGLAFELQGHEIEKVALAFYPRSGWLKSMHTWVAPYDRELALAAYQRPYEIADVLTRLEVMDNPQRWAEVPAAPGNQCGFCPWYDPGRVTPADDTGCPGK
jgi:hypothetical protein